jgi:hypothetical protein
MIAAVFMLRGEFNAAFVVAVVGLVSWFLNYRAQVTRSLEAEDQGNDEEGIDRADED